MTDKERIDQEIDNVMDGAAREAEELAEDVAQAVSDEIADGRECDDAQSLMASLEEEKEDYKNALIRERADFENYKKRNATLAGDSYKNGVADAVSALLPVMDNFERALAASCADQAFADGMRMIQKQMQDAMAALGVEEIGAEGQFDPNVHNAVMQVEEKGYKSNDVVETLQKGYKMNDRVLRHAMVKVNK